MTIAHALAILITLIGGLAFIGIMIWAFDRSNEAFEEAVIKPRLARRPTTKPTPALPTPEAVTAND
jgi:hypothetical protein